MQPSLKNSEPGIVTYAWDKCSLGYVLVATSEQGICGSFLGDDVETVSAQALDRFPGARAGADAQLRWLVHQVKSMVESPLLEIDLPLDIQGTPFQRQVWQAIREIPAGTTASYSEIARRIGAADSVRAVARACGVNPLAILIPCHRVVRRDRGLSGYRWGVDRKRALLQREDAL